MSVAMHVPIRLCQTGSGIHQKQEVPLVRGLYYIIKENYYGLGSGLVDFMKYERGN